MQSDTSAAQNVFDKVTQLDEGALVEYKRTFPNLLRNAEKKEFIKDIVTFANQPRDNDAYIVYGIECNDRRKPNEIKFLGLDPGFQLDEGQIHGILSSSASPKIDVRVEMIPNDKGTFCVIVIPPSREIPHFMTMDEAIRCPARRGNITVYLTAEEIEKLIIQRHLKNQNPLEASFTHLKSMGWDSFDFGIRIKNHTKESYDEVLIDFNVTVTHMPDLIRPFKNWCRPRIMPFQEHIQNFPGHRVDYFYKNGEYFKPDSGSVVWENAEFAMAVRYKMKDGTLKTINVPKTPAGRY